MTFRESIETSLHRVLRKALTNYVNRDRTVAVENVELDGIVYVGYKLCIFDIDQVELHSVMPYLPKDDIGEIMISVSLTQYPFDDVVELLTVALTHDMMTR